MLEVSATVLSQSLRDPHTAPYLRERPRGLGLLQLPTGMTDERSAPFLPNIYVAGNKVSTLRVALNSGSRCRRE